jgi:transcriptional regulator with XRE-family HTH domain
MTMQTLTEELTSTPDALRLYQQERAILDVTELICELMERENTSRSKLARRLGRTKGYITQMLDGRTNMTIRTVADVMTALGFSVRVQADPLEAVEWQSFTKDLGAIPPMDAWIPPGEPKFMLKNVPRMPRETGVAA